MEGMNGHNNKIKEVEVVILIGYLGKASWRRRSHLN
jgi:hypothetical protein